MYEEIVDLFERRGWNLYNVGTNQNQRIIDIVPNGKIYYLERESNYLVLPRIKDHNNAECMVRALATMAKRKIGPIVTIKGVEISLVAFLVGRYDFTIHGRKDIRCTYTEFKTGIGTLCDRVEN